MKKEIVKTTIRVPRDLWAKVRGKAIEEGRSTQDVIHMLLKGWLEGKNKLESKLNRRSGRGNSAS